MSHPDSLGPTAERLSKSEGYDAPHVDKDTNRLAYRVLTIFETLHKRGDIEGDHLAAAKKLEKHYLGALGHDVRTGEGSTEDPLEYPRSYHAQKLAQAQSEILHREWIALHILLDERGSLIEIGRTFRPIGSREIARATGLAIVTTGLERLAYLWGFKSEKGKS